jgi:hypothetical protein
MQGTAAGENDVGLPQRLALAHHEFRCCVIERRQIVHHVVDERRRLEGEGGGQREGGVDPHHALPLGIAEHTGQLLQVVGHHLVEESDVVPGVRDLQPHPGEAVAALENEVVARRLLVGERHRLLDERDA